MYKLLLGDAHEQVSLLASDSIDVLISDIPYGVNINSSWDRQLPNSDFWNECYRVLKPGSHCIIFGQPSMTQNLMSVMSNTNFNFRDLWIWQYQGTHTKGTKVNTEFGLFRSRIRNVFNPIFVFRKKLCGTEIENWERYGVNLLNIDGNRELYEGDHSSIISRFKSTGEKHLQSLIPSNTFKSLNRKGWVPDERGREPTNIKYFSRATTAEKTINGLISNTHETVKPIKLMLWLVRLTTFQESQIVLDPFCGTGSTGCACELLNRQFIGIDNDDNSINIAKKRIDHVREIKL